MENVTKVFNNLNNLPLEKKINYILSLKSWEQRAAFIKLLSVNEKDEYFKARAKENSRLTAKREEERRLKEKKRLENAQKSVNRTIEFYKRVYNAQDSIINLVSSFNDKVINSRFEMALNETLEKFKIRVCIDANFKGFETSHNGKFVITAYDSSGLYDTSKSFDVCGIYNNAYTKEENRKEFCYYNGKTYRIDAGVVTKEVENCMSELKIKIDSLVGFQALWPEKLAAYNTAVEELEKKKEELRKFRDRMPREYTTAFEFAMKDFR